MLAETAAGEDILTKRRLPLRLFVHAAAGRYVFLQLSLTSATCAVSPVRLSGMMMMVTLFGSYPIQRSLRRD